MLALVGVLGTAATPARAQEADPDEEALGQLPVPGPLGAGLGWNAGPVYGLDAPLKVRGRMGLTLELDGGWLGGDLEGGLDGAVRRGRFHTLGRLHHWAGPAYKFQFAVEDGEVFLNDFYLRWRTPGRWVHDLTAGYFDPPTGLSALASSTARSLMEMAAPAAAFAPGYRLGFALRGTRPGPDLSWALGVSSVGQSTQNAAEASESVLRGNARLVWRPWHEEEEGRSLLHLGLSLGATLSGGGELRYRARPESFLAEFLVDTGEIEGDAGLVAAEVAWRRGPLSVQAELFRVFVETDGETAQLGGGYVQVGRVLTGEFRPYDRPGAVFGRVGPARALAPRTGGWGALELTGRLSWIDLDDGRVRGGRMLVTNVGLVWTWNAYVRVHAGWAFARSDRRSEVTHAHILQSRFELHF